MAIAGCSKEEAAGPPPPPTVTAPLPNAPIVSPLTVTGTAQPGAQIWVTVRTTTADLNATTGNTDAAGAFSVIITYPNQPADTPLQVEVVQLTAGGPSPPVVIDVAQDSQGHTYATSAEAPTYSGTDFTDMQIYDVGRGVYLDEIALLELLDPEDVVYFGEQHETAPVQELQLWLLQRMTARHDNVTLAMEHFQADEQSVVDDYLAGTITESAFLNNADPWPNFAQYWKPLVDHMKDEGRPVVATNIPDEALNAIYANGLSTRPLDFFNSWGSTSPYDAYLPPRPVADWNTLYQDYFETGFDYASHGQNWGLTYQEALDYFTDLAILRDHVMGYWVAQHIDNTQNRVLYVGGDWHVQTGIATPDIATTWSSTITSVSLITTVPLANFQALASGDFQGRAYADYILVYQ